MKMTNSGARLLAASIIVLAGSLAVGLGDVAHSGGTNSIALMVGGWLLAIGGLLFVIDYFRSWATDTK
jgi:hypothetical protein